jgi:hypothetical protein
MASEYVSSGPGARDAKIWSCELPPGAKAKSNWSEMFAERAGAMGGPEAWGEGPWRGEPDRVEWRKADMPGIVMLAQRNAFGAWCGYVGVPPENPAHGKDWSTIDGSLNVHGGLTYGAACEGHICHVPEPGEIEHLWWLGFDCNHGGDFAPGMVSTLRLSARRRLQEIEAKVGPLALDIEPDVEWLKQQAEAKPYQHAAPPFPDAVDYLLRDTYRDFDYVRSETEQLAAQLFIAGMVGSLPPAPDFSDEEPTISEKPEP